MTCNYIEYQRMTNSLFFGVALTDKHMNEATEHIRSYFINGGLAVYRWCLRVVDMDKSIAKYRGRFVGKL